MSHDEVLDDLPSLLRGELDRPALAALLAHLRGCPDCTAELLDLAQAHSAVLAARATLAAAGPAAASAGTGEPTAARSWAPPRLPEWLPEWQGRGGRRERLVLVAAAVVAVVGVATGVVLGQGGREAPQATPTPTSTATASPSPTQPVQQATAELLAVSGAGHGQVTMRTPLATGVAQTEMAIRTDGLQPPGAGKFYYAWLFDPATNKMLALGVVGPDGTARFSIDPAIVAQYHAIDVSLQADNGDPAHSATSVLRGSY